MTFQLPDWIDPLIDPERRYPDVDDRMDLVIDLSHRDVELGTGGRFGLAEWKSARVVRGIRVTRDIRRPEARAVLTACATSGGTIYNGRRVG